MELDTTWKTRHNATLVSKTLLLLHVQATMWSLGPDSPDGTFWLLLVIYEGHLIILSINEINQIREHQFDTVAYEQIYCQLAVCTSNF